MADDAGAENAAAGADHHLDHAGRHALDLGAVVLGEGEAQHAHGRPVALARGGLVEADGGQRRVGEGDEGRLGGAVGDAAGGRGSTCTTCAA